MKIGYARTSTREQHLDIQRTALKEAGCDRIFEEQVSGVGAVREQLQQCLQFCREGDCLVVYKLDRLGRSMRDLLDIIEQLRQRNISLVSIRDNIDTGSTTGKLVLHIFSALAEFERDLILDRTSEGRREARKRGVKFGRPKQEKSDKAVACANLYRSGMTVPQIMQQLSIRSKSTVYRFLRQGGVEPSRIRKVSRTSI
jgi:DNA invertase Pin-like site-specific DNA recombinase